jgi:hypothetical protein
MKLCFVGLESFIALRFLYGSPARLSLQSERWLTGDTLSGRFITRIGLITANGTTFAVAARG